MKKKKNIKKLNNEKRVTFLIFSIPSKKLIRKNNDRWKKSRKLLRIMRMMRRKCLGGEGGIHLNGWKCRLRKRYFDIPRMYTLSMLYHRLRVRILTPLNSNSSPPPRRNVQHPRKSVRLSVISHCYLAKLRRIVSDLTRHSSLPRCATKENILTNVSSFTFSAACIFHGTYTILDGSNFLHLNPSFPRNLLCQIFRIEMKIFLQLKLPFLTQKSNKRK